MAASERQALTPPRVYLLRMAVFLVLGGFLAFILQRTIWTAFLYNPGLNGLIVGVLLVGVILALRQVWRLFREVRFANHLRSGVDAPPSRPPVILSPLAAAMGDRGQPSLTPTALRALLDTVGGRLEESRDIVRYLASLLILLGLLGTFWGLIETVGAVGRSINALRTGSEATVLFDELKASLAAPLSGIGVAFSSSLFGLASSLILGFLDLQAGQAQTRFYNELEDLLTAFVATEAAPSPAMPVHAMPSPDLAVALNRLTAAVNDGAGGRAATQAMASLAEGIQGLVQHMRAEQQMIRDWVEAQASRERELKQILERISRERA